MPTYQSPRGMRDLLPEEAGAFDALQRVVMARAERYGFGRVMTPLVEDRGVFLRTAGDTSDLAGKEMYDVSLHGEGGLALRPEGTAPVTRAFIQHGLHKTPQPVRLSYWEPMFRGQRPQAMRFRQFWQWGLENFGSAEPTADAEIVEFTAGLFAEVGLSGVELQLNTIGDEACRPKIKEALTAYFSKHREALDEDCKRRLDSSVLRIFDCKNPGDQAIAAGAPKVRDLICDEDREHFAGVTSALDLLGVNYRIVDGLVRGLDYYTRTVCEFVLLATGETRGGVAIAAGGRYDGLVKTMGGPATSGVGIAGGVDVLYFALKAQGVKLGEEQQADVYVVSADPDDGAARSQLAMPLREAGFSVAVDYSKRTLEKQLESAVKHGAKVAVIRGTPEAGAGNVIIRDLLNKVQRVTPFADAVAQVGKHVRPRPRPKLIDEPGAAGETPYLEAEE